MPKIKGPNGLVLEVSDDLAESLLKNVDDYVIVAEPKPKAVPAAKK
jgi:hypothetical protein